ncbi:MAG: M23 family metallopeptidase [Solirubrobacterales bacterium]
MLIALALIVGSPAAGVAHADSSGGSGFAKPARPVLTNVQCAFNRSDPCIETHRVESGGAIALRGHNLAAATGVIFYGGRSRADDVTVPTAGTTADYAKAPVPANARSGPIAALTGAGTRSARWSGLVIEDPATDLHPYRQSSLAAPVQATLSKPRRIYLGGLHKAVFTYQVGGQQSLDVQVTLVRTADGAVVRTWLQPAVSAGAIKRVAWDGTGGGGKALAAGSYYFQLSAPGSAAATQAPPSPRKRDSVVLRDFVFPILGPHTFAIGGGSFGASRPGRTHQGQDVLASCGRPLVAARGGKVLFAGFQSLAGYYIVIDGQDTGYDFAYLHLREPAMVGTGDRVYTGQQLGYVGDTGNSSACHLHFEMWTAPGWYRGGHAVDPLKSLQRWDRGSR